MSSVKDQTINSVKWTAIEKYSVQGIQFLLGLIMARLLVPSDYGIVGMLAIFIGVSQTFVDSGFGQALIRKQDRTEADCSTVFYFSIVMSFLCYLILFITAPFIAKFYEMSILESILRVQSLSIVISSLVSVNTAKLTINLNFKALAKINMVSSLISGIIGVVAAYNSFGVWALVIQDLLRNIMVVIMTYFICRWTPLLSFSTKSFKEFFSFGSRMLAANLLGTIYFNLNSLVIGKFYTAKDLGYYSRGTQIASYPVSNINGVISKVVFPILSKIQDDTEKLINVYRKYICISSMLIFFCCSLLVALAEPLVIFILTDKWHDAIIYLQIFSFSMMFDHLCTINLNLLLVKGRSDLILRLEIIKRIISLSILFASIPFGVLAICISKVIYTQIAVVINTYYTGKLFGLGYVKQVKDFSGFFFISLISCIPAYLINYAPLPNIMKLIVGSLESLLIYYYMLRKNEYMIEVTDLIKTKAFKIC